MGCNVNSEMFFFANIRRFFSSADGSELRSIRAGGLRFFPETALIFHHHEDILTGVRSGSYIREIPSLRMISHAAENK